MEQRVLDPPLLCINKFRTHSSTRLRCPGTKRPKAKYEVVKKKLATTTGRVSTRAAGKPPLTMLRRAGITNHRSRTFRRKVGDSGFEPLTPSASRKRSPPELIARIRHPSRASFQRRHPESNRGTGFCRPLPIHSAMSPTCRRHRTTPPAPLARGQSGRRDSNPRPSPWQGDALPAELLPRCSRSNNLARSPISYKHHKQPGCEAIDDLAHEAFTARVADGRRCPLQ